MALPTEYDTVNVFRDYTFLDGTVPTGTVEFAGKVRARALSSGRTILPTSIIAQIDADGHISVNLPATDDPDISPNGWTYTVTEKFTGKGSSAGQTFELAVPISAKGSGIDLGQYSPATPASGDPTTFVTMSAWQAVYTGAVLLSRNKTTGVWPSRPNVVHVTWVDTLPGSAKVPIGMTTGDLYVGPDGMGGLAPGGVLP